MATNEELEKRICALEAQAREDNSMVFKKAPNIVNRLLVAYERIEALEEGFQRERENTMCDMDKLFEQLSDAHNVLCDALIQYGAVVDDADGDAYDIAINDARIPQNDDDEDDLMDNDNRDFLLSATGEELEAQDEPRNCTDEDDEQSQGNDTLQGDNVSPETDIVDALMGELQDKFVTIIGNVNRDEMGTVGAMLETVRPTIEKLVRENKNLKQISSTGYANELLDRAERAEARCEELKSHGRLGMARARYEKAEAERDAMREAVEVLRKYISTMLFPSDVRFEAEQALAKYDEAQKGGNE
jgi:hypothetical protein